MSMSAYSYKYNEIRPKLHIKCIWLKKNMQSNGALKKQNAFRS